MGKNQHPLPLWHIAQTMTAGIACAVRDMAFVRLAMSIGAAGTQGGDGLRGNRQEAEDHGQSLVTGLPRN